AYNIGDQYMFGPALLVNPVLEQAAGDGNDHSRSVYLPAGTSWHDFWTGDYYGGGQTIDADAGLATMPLFVRAGSIVPIGPDVQHSGEQPDAPWTLLIYGGADGSFVLYEDEGDGYGYEQGEHAAVTLLYHDQSRTLTFGSRQGSYGGMNVKRSFQVKVMTEGMGYLDEAGIPARQTVEYEGSALTIQL
ncbi:DUF5110 domain-containing protein, partial [Paenibacillus sepulcri]|nr:DUF5110 domain-containing protein [Paenibacillus sepulcri]